MGESAAAVEALSAGSVLEQLGDESASFASAPPSASPHAAKEIANAAPMGTSELVRREEAEEAEDTTPDKTYLSLETDATMAHVGARSSWRDRAELDGDAIRIEVEHRRSSLALPRRHVHEHHAIDRKRPAILVNVSEEVKAGLKQKDAIAQVCAALSATRRGPIADSLWRPMRDEYMRVIRDLRPLLCERRAAREIERPVMELGLPRTSPEPHAFERDPAVLEIVDIGPEQCARLGGMIEERPVMIAGDDDLVSMGKRLHEQKRLLQLGELASTTEVSSMDEDIARRDDKVVMKEMGVGDRDDPHPESLSGSRKASRRRVESREGSSKELVATTAMSESAGSVAGVDVFLGCANAANDATSSRGMTSAYRRRMKLLRVATVAALLFASSRALAETPPAQGTTEPENDGPSELLMPRPPEWKLQYDEARAALATGEFADAAKKFAALEASAVNRVDRALAREQRTLAAEWASRGLVFVHRADTDATDSAKAVDKRTVDELVSLYTNAVFYGLGTGVTVGVLTKPSSAAGAILPTIALTGASVGAVIALDSGRGFHYGVPQSIVSGLYVGLEEGIAWTVFANSRRGVSDMSDGAEAATIWGLATAGAVTGGALGHALGTTPGRSAWVGSTALWGGTVAAFATGALADKDNPPASAFALAGVGLTVGTGVGLATASSVSPSIARVRLLDLGGVSGGLLGAGLYAAAANEKIDGRALSGVTAIGAVAGLGAAWALTSSMHEDRPRDPSAREQAIAERIQPMVSPTKGGAMLGIGGAL